MNRVWCANGFAMRCLALLAVLAAAPVGAAEVVLTSHDGQTRITGDLLDSSAEGYQVRTAFGVLIVDPALVDCAGPGCPAPERPAIVLSPAHPALRPVAEALVADYAASRGMELASADAEGARLLIDAGGAEVATVATAPGGVTLAYLPRGAAGPDAAVLESTDLVFAVDASNPVTSLSRDQIAAVLSGRITNWSELGGPDAPLAIGIEQGMEAGLAAFFPAAAARLSGGAPAIEAPDAARLTVTTGTALGDRRALGIDTNCGVMRAAPFDLAAGQYPLGLDLVLDMPRRPSDALKAIAATAPGPARADILVRPTDSQGDHILATVRNALAEGEENALERLSRDLAGGAQLSAVFRFGSNDSRTGPDHAALAARVADWLGTLPVAPGRIHVLGFSDGLESGGRRVGLSRSRAAAVEDLLAEAGGPDAVWRGALRSAGYEGLAPRACNATPDGRALNRRVEIWISPAG